MSGVFSVIDARSLAHRAVTEGVNLKYVEQMRQALYAAADRVEQLEDVLREIADNHYTAGRAREVLEAANSQSRSDANG